MTHIGCPLGPITIIGIPFAAGASGTPAGGAPPAGHIGVGFLFVHSTKTSMAANRQRWLRDWRGLRQQEAVLLRGVAAVSLEAVQVAHRACEEAVQGEAAVLREQLGRVRASLRAATARVTAGPDAPTAQELLAIAQPLHAAIEAVRSDAMVAFERLAGEEASLMKDLEALAVTDLLAPLPPFLPPKITMTESRTPTATDDDNVDTEGRRMGEIANPALAAAEAFEASAKARAQEVEAEFRLVSGQLSRVWFSWLKGERSLFESIAERAIARGLPSDETSSTSVAVSLTAASTAALPTASASEVEQASTLWLRRRAVNRQLIDLTKHWRAARVRLLDEQHKAHRNTVEAAEAATQATQAQQAAVERQRAEARQRALRNRVALWKARREGLETPSADQRDIHSPGTDDGGRRREQKRQTAREESRARIVEWRRAKEAASQGASSSQRINVSTTATKDPRRELAAKSPSPEATPDSEALRRRAQAAMQAGLERRAAVEHKRAEQRAARLRSQGLVVRSTETPRQSDGPSSGVPLSATSDSGPDAAATTPPPTGDSVLHVSIPARLATAKRNSARLTRMTRSARSAATSAEAVIAAAGERAERNVHDPTNTAVLGGRIQSARRAGLRDFTFGGPRALAQPAWMRAIPT